MDAYKPNETLHNYVEAQLYGINIESNMFLISQNTVCFIKSS